MTYEEDKKLHSNCRRLSRDLMAKLESANQQVELMREVCRAAKEIDEGYVDWKKLGLGGVHMLEALEAFQKEASVKRV